jgi:DNA-binding LytR/AlgR family response regulator
VVLVVNGVAYQHVDVESSLMIWLYATIVTLAIVVMFVTLGELMRSPAAVPTETAAAPPAAAPARSEHSPAPLPPAILERVPLPQRGKLIALIVEDHYVDIVTDKGKTLVLMRLADAIREAAPVLGLQVHRSHWVALDAVLRTQRSEGKIVIELANGMKLPVSRGYLPAAKEAGLVV